MTPLVILCALAMLLLFLPSRDPTLEMSPHCGDAVYLRKARINICPSCRKVFV
jgi:hypothetical protein